MRVCLDFEAHFRDAHRKQSRSDRTLFVHVTSVVVSDRFLSLPSGIGSMASSSVQLQDTKGTMVTLTAVEDSILRRHLVKAQLL